MLGVIWGSFRRDLKKFNSWQHWPLLPLWMVKGSRYMIKFCKISMMRFFWQLNHSNDWTVVSDSDHFYMILEFYRKDIWCANFEQYWPLLPFFMKPRSGKMVKFWKYRLCVFFFEKTIIPKTAMNVGDHSVMITGYFKRDI